ncbi:vWA domain-containing protein [Cerasicoccus arenae]|uniref:VWFA domain-containing protein n=1 Tax=Cerasicoccus arenae TaxID=424488 RepID=A0A8J3D7X9_9BACT|nr:von Willebrand factor type A domain-containing protein [Cerasicoccus arenae]MBK1859933.1 von Willebrand factor type A domain-containing protein [Cerasicoccus arenae]GHB93484.1 hypothetical protein GCM10007047_06190 [Cerasicoccus arenae]
MSDQKPLREELESRIIAQLSGELTSAESEELEAVVAHDTELQQFRERMRSLIGSIGEEAEFFELSDENEANAPSRLSKERRAHVHALISENEPAESKKRRSLRFHSPIVREEWNARRLLTHAAVLIVLIGILAAILIPTVGGARKSAHRAAEEAEQIYFSMDSETERPSAPALRMPPKASTPPSPREDNKPGGALNQFKDYNALFQNDEIVTPQSGPTRQLAGKETEASAIGGFKPEGQGQSVASSASEVRDGFIGNLNRSGRFDYETEYVYRSKGLVTDKLSPSAEIELGYIADDKSLNGVFFGDRTDGDALIAGNQDYLISEAKPAEQPARGWSGEKLAEKDAHVSSGLALAKESTYGLYADSTEKKRDGYDYYSPKDSSSASTLNDMASAPTVTTAPAAPRTIPAPVLTGTLVLEESEPKKQKIGADQSILVAGEAMKLLENTKRRNRVIPSRTSVQTGVPLPEKTAVDAPFSTFSLNVSDVSFRLAEAALERHTLPSASEIRAEEFINALPPEMPTTAAAQDVRFDWELSDYPFAHNRQLLRFAVQAASTGRLPSQPANLVLVVDCSGSMQRTDRQEILRDSLSALAEKLGPQDRLSAVVFASTARVVADGTNGAAVADVINRILTQRPEGGTNLELALQEAYALAQRNQVAGGINRVVLLTDGAANLGEVNANALNKLVTTNRQRDIALDAFGIGWDGYNDTLLEALTRNSNGRYAFLNSPESAGEEFANKLVGALNLAAADVKVQIEWNPSRVISYRQLGYEKHQLKTEDFRNNAVDAAELSAAEAGQALYVVQLRPDAIGGLGTLRVRYLDPHSGQYEELAWPLEYPANITALETASASHRLATAGALLADKLAQTPNAEAYELREVEALTANLPPSYSQNNVTQRLRTMIRQARQILSE